MKMKEVCTRSGLTEKAVRLYCERGLVHPEKYWERGREYLIFSDHNLRELAIISELRRAEFTLDEIALMLESPERCGDVLAGWRGRVTEQNQRLTNAKGKLDELSTQENLSAERLAELLGAKITAHGAAPYRGETFAEFCERAPAQTDYSPEMLEISQKEEKRERIGRLFMILYGVIMGLVSMIHCAVLYTQSQMLLPGLIQIFLFVFLTVYLFKGALWARVISIVRHGLSAVTTALLIPEYLPGTKVFVEIVHSSDGTFTPVYHAIPMETGVLVIGLLTVAVLLDLFCVYMLWFHKGVKDYLYERSL